jgi:hypothetical protein
MKYFEKRFIIILFDIFFDIYFLTDDSQLFFSNYSIYFFIRSYKKSSSGYSYIKRKNKKCILNEKN